MTNTKKTLDNINATALTVRKHSVICNLDDKTQQDHYESTKINNIVRAYNNANVDLLNSATVDIEKDALQIDLNADLHTVQSRIVELQSTFINKIPSRVRAEFDNDPMKMIKFLQNPKNKERAIELGLIKVVEAPAPTAPISQVENLIVNQKNEKN